MRDRLQVIIEKSMVENHVSREVTAFGGDNETFGGTRIYSEASYPIDPDEGSHIILGVCAEVC